MAQQAPSHPGQALVDLSNAIVALHRRHFGRGPGAAKSFLSDGMAICVLSDVYTAVERTLIEAGQGEHVRRTRALHQQALEHEYRRRAEAIIGAPVSAYLSVANVEPDVCVEIFFLEGRAGG